MKRENQRRQLGCKINKFDQNFIGTLTPNHFSSIDTFGIIVVQKTLNLMVSLQFQGNACIQFRFLKLSGYRFFIPKPNLNLYFSWYWEIYFSGIFLIFSPILYLIKIQFCWSKLDQGQFFIYFFLVRKYINK